MRCRQMPRQSKATHPQEPPALHLNRFTKQDIKQITQDRMAKLLKESPSC